MLKFLVGILFLGNVLCSQEYRFAGKHFVSSYLDCDLKALTDLEALVKAMDDAVVASGATILDKTPFVFPPNGMTIVYTLSESHASIHTYPEHGSCFVDLFTCGDNCCSIRFHEALQTYLKPKQVDAHLFLRSDTLEEVPLQQ